MSNFLRAVEDLRARSADFAATQDEHREQTALVERFMRRLQMEMPDHLAGMDADDIAFEIMGSDAALEQIRANAPMHDVLVAAHLCEAPCAVYG